MANPDIVVALFQVTSVVQNYTIKTALWDLGDSIYDKQSLKTGVEFFVANGAVSRTVTVDSEVAAQSSDPVNVPPLSNVIWVNNSNDPVTWVNLMGQTVLWSTFTGLGSFAID